MAGKGFTKDDWQVFKEKIVGWQEKYMDRLNKEYIEILSENTSSAERFWKLDKRIREDKKRPGVVVTMRKTEMFSDIMGLINDGVISLEDIEDFSDEFKETVRAFLNNG